MVEVFIEDQAVDGSPFACNAYNINNIKVTGLDNAKVSLLTTYNFLFIDICIIFVYRQVNQLHLVLMLQKLVKVH